MVNWVETSKIFCQSVPEYTTTSPSSKLAIDPQLALIAPTFVKANKSLTLVVGGAMEASTISFTSFWMFTPVEFAYMAKITAGTVGSPTGFLAKDDKIRIMGNVNSTSVILDAIYPAGEPVVPAVIIAMYANSTGVNIQKEVNDIVDASIAPPTTNVDDLFALTNVGAIDASWGSIANLEEGDVVVYSGTDWQIVLDVSTQFTKGEYQVYNGADNKVYYFDGLVWKQIADGADEPWFGTDDDAAATTNTEAIYIQAPWVGIGQTRPSTTGGPGGTGNGERLWVDGSIRTTNSIYADYVLEHYVDGTSKSNPEYVPTSLEEADAYIKANKHLPGVTGVDELIKTEKGYNFNITELSVQSLEKIEELYLHTIEQQKRIEALQVQMQAMQVQIQALLTKEK